MIDWLHIDNECACPLLADIVAKAFLGWRKKILRAADAFYARRREGPYRFIQDRSRTSVVALKSDAAAEKSKDKLSRDFPGRFTVEPPRSAYFLAQNGMATAHFLSGRYEDGSLWAKVAVQQNPNYVGAHRMMMSCHAMAGRVEEARQAWAVARQLDPTQRISIVLKRWFRRPQDIQRYAEAFRIAGMPE